MQFWLVTPWKPRPVKKIFFARNFKYDSLWKLLLFLEIFYQKYQKSKKNIWREFGGNFDPLGKVRAKVIVQILKLKMALLLKVTFIEEMFFISSKNVIAFRRYCRFCKKYIAETAGSGNFLMKQLSVITSFLFLLYKLNMHALLQTHYKWHFDVLSLHLLPRRKARHYFWKLMKYQLTSSSKYVFCEFQTLKSLDELLYLMSTRDCCSGILRTLQRYHKKCTLIVDLKNCN